MQTSVKLMSIPEFAEGLVHEVVQHLAVVVRETGEEAIDVLTVRQRLSFAVSDCTAPCTFFGRPPEACVQIPAVADVGRRNVQALVCRQFLHDRPQRSRGGESRRSGQLEIARLAERV